MEKSLAQIAMEAFLATTCTAQDTFDRVAKAVEKEVLARLKKSEFEPVAGQELSFVQVAQWVEKHGSTKGLQWLCGGNWRDADATVIHVFVDYRVAPKKVKKLNDPDDHTTWQDDVDIFARDNVSKPWIATKFKGYFKNFDYPYRTLKTSDGSSFKFAKLATPEQIEAWKLINEEPQ